MLAYDLQGYCGTLMTPEALWQALEYVHLHGTNALRAQTNADPLHAQTFPTIAARREAQERAAPELRLVHPEVDRGAGAPGCRPGERP